MSALPRPQPEQGWTATPHSYFKNLPRKLSYVEFVILGNILDETVGGKGRPQWARITHAQFAYWANCTEDGAAKAIRRMELPTEAFPKALGLIETRKIGRHNEYRPLPQNWEQAPERLARKLNGKVIEMPAILRARGFQPVPMECLCEHCRPLFVPEKPKSENKAKGEGKENEAILESGYSATKLQNLHTTKDKGVREQTANGNDVKSPSPRRGPSSERTKGENCSESVQNGAKGVKSPPESGGMEGEKVQAIYDFLVQVVTPRLASPPPAKICQELAHILSEPPFPLFQTRVKLRLHKITDWGMLIGLARDVRSAYRHMEEQRLAIEKRQQDWTDRRAAEQRKEALRTLANLIEAGNDADAAWMAGEDHELLAEAQASVKGGS